MFKRQQEDKAFLRTETDAGLFFFSILLRSCRGRFGSLRRPLYPTTTRHDRSAKQDNDNCAQFAVNDVPDNSQLSFTHGRQLSRLDRLAPGAEFNRRYDGQKCDGDKDGEFRHEGVTMKIVGRALLKEKHPQQSDHEKEARREPKHSAPS